MTETLTDEQRVGVLLDHVTRLRARLLDVLRAPYMGPPNTAISITAACVELDHPIVRNDRKSCACGKRS